ncbi:hypothetical protein DFH08DRAFT_686024 [Mycena albidolilacea]|uniref:T6SS Phospholipase effector Tle1-like catalytic domain-containing protein n=1 Tax=Mycena albidolilacea TaxID=1033008 RepID=A0AAD7AIX4_9AGAR|nr:hypothetical protein DFH08DRAFT_686024 [Mycena albidolilacea]
MNFQSLPLPPSKFPESRDLLRPVHLCGCNCIDACKCACSCRDHCACEARCNGTCTAHLTRNLVVCLDDVVTELGEQNTNVLELYSRVLVDPGRNQLTYYGCSSGVYTSSHEGRIKHWFRHVENAVERAIGWNSKKALLKAYLWICEHYKPGDKIFLFGFSRGAYEVQTLAAMIDKVGLVNAGNEELVPLSVFSLDHSLLLMPIFRAYDVFLEAEIFKTTFARNIRIHFVGAWDTVSCSKILGKSHLLPTSAEHACIFRHALALDEYRVKMITAIAHPPPPQIHDKEKDDASSTETKISSGITIGKRTQIFQETGMESDAVLSSVPLLWMENEATSAGLRLQSRTCQRARELREAGDVPKLSSSPVQRLSDLPFVQRASFNLGSTRYVHLFCLNIF